jgi:hypothetical protein
MSRFCYPALFLFTGAIIFYSQVIFSWWHPNSPQAMFLSLFSAAVLILGIIIVLDLFYRGLTNAYRELLELGFSPRVALLSITLVMIYLAFAFFSALKPAHRFTEGDFLEYHLYLPKQHWLRGNWSPLDWSTIEFVTLTIDYALSFFWISLPLLNRAPQFLIECFLLLKILYVFKFFKIDRPFATGFLAVLGFISFRVVTIQTGTAMLDLVNLYFGFSVFFFLAFLGNRKAADGWISSTLLFLFGVDIAAYLGHKSFGAMFLGATFLSLELLLRKFYKRSLIPNLKVRSWILISIPALVMWVPCLIRSYHFTGDPFYPVLSRFLPPHCSPEALSVRTCQDNLSAAIFNYDLTQGYGYGRTFLGFFKSFIKAPLPSPIFSRQGFFFGSNKFDYPLGVFWFFAWGLFFWSWIKEKIDRKILGTFGGMALVLYLLWFGLSQQGRWLYPVILILSLFWGFALSQNAKWLKVAILTCWICVIVNASKILLSQQSNLGCFGAACLTFQPELYNNYKAPCLGKELVIHQGSHLGYFNCPVSTPRSDFPWVKN